MADQAPPSIEACVEQAAAHYSADGARVLALVKERGGRTGEIRVLPNGEIEVGLSRIPGRELPALEPFGITARSLADDDCLNVAIATYLYQRAEQARGHAALALADAAASPVVNPQFGSALQAPDPCMASAATRYSIPMAVMQAVVRTEGGWDGLRKRNTNGSFDLGRAQINTIHLPELRRYGITEQQLANDACTNLHVAAYRLRFEINRAGDFWRGVGNYHSRTPHLNQAYQTRVRANLARLTAKN